MKYLGKITDNKDLVTKEYVDNAVAGAGGGTVSGVKGNSESTYRTGNVNLTAANIGAVPTTRTVNSKALSSDISLSASDVGAVPTTRTVNSKALSSDISLSASDVGAVPTTRKVNGKALSSDVIVYPYYGTCTIAAATAAKTVTVDSSFSLVTGANVCVKFSNANSASSPTLNVNSTGAKAIMRYGTTAGGTAASTSWQAGSTVSLTYDGTNWIIDNFNNTTYSNLTEAEYQAATVTTGRLVPPTVFKAGIQYWMAQGNVLQTATPTKVSGSKWTSGTITVYRRGVVGYLKVNGAVLSQVTARTTVATVPSTYYPVTETSGYLDGGTTQIFLTAGGELRFNPVGASTYWGGILYLCAN